ncbi:DUF6166 domain-containing protein [Mycobacterium sp. 29Ha]|uniref:DUF6166 domain-containing protein n=1 Tax=Mycobacterium sp. 29Ha TaxID=2939268 RepID=UPI002938D607|nr:DUF6166 domain-containing protein [Mycobacterium sp. 29Ha]MDV3133353.1 hypothetical protein [Mycobacterium sp. 29Ha]
MTTASTPITGTGVIYRGHPDGRTVTVERGTSQPLRVLVHLPHIVKHSPTGMTWGYCGAGPADLARSLLIHALGSDARCTVCDGSNNVVYDTATDSDVPAQRADDVRRIDEQLASARFSPPMPCLACEGGWALPPAAYQHFKFDVIAGLPEAGWTLTRTEVLSWYQRYQKDNPT